jgi:hypothetical protein
MIPLKIPPFILREPQSLSLSKERTEEKLKSLEVFPFILIIMKAMYSVTAVI